MAKKKRVVKEAFGGDSDDGEDESKKKRVEAGEGEKEPEVTALPPVSDSEDEGPDDKAEAPKRIDSSDEDDEVRRNPDGRDDNERSRLSDFDMMMELKRAEGKKRRKKKDIDLINDNDDAIARLIADMRLAAREDRELNLARAPAVKKIAMLPMVMAQLKKADLQMAFVEANVLSVMTDWLAPMPDKSLPSLKIRQELLKLLFALRIDDQSRLKESGIGKAVMYLYKHPKELRINKELAGRIVTTWARPIFNKSMDYKTISKEERRANDEQNKDTKRRKIEEPEEPEEGLRPGDPGWVARARVPQPSGKEYVSRPDWQTTVDISQTKKKERTRLEKHMLLANERKKNSKDRRAVTMSLEGTKMPL